VAFREGFFQVILNNASASAFQSANYLFWPMAALLLIFVLDVLGEVPGVRPAGGIKMARHLIVLKILKVFLSGLITQTHLLR